MDPYLTLGVSRDSNREEVKDAFRVKAQQLHPDRGGEDLSFIQLRTAYEQILAELDHPDDSDAETPGQARRHDHPQAAHGPRVSGDTYESWLRNVAAQAGRKQSVWRSARTRAAGMIVLLTLIVANLAAVLFFWIPNRIRPSTAPPVELADGQLEQDPGPGPIRRDVTPGRQRRWQKSPRQLADLFIIPYDAILYIAPVEGDRGRTTEFGLVTPQGDVFPIFTGLPGHPNPAREVEIGPVSAGSKLRVYLKKGDTWAFSDAADSAQSSETFRDRDNRLGGGGSIVERVDDSTTWILHLEDIGSTHEDHEDILIQVRLGPMDL